MKLTVENRSLIGKKVKSLRKEMKVPAVIYGKHLDKNIHVTLDKNAFLKIHHEAWKSKPIDLISDDSSIKEMVLIHDIQVDPVTNYVLHVDFVWIKKGEKVHTTVDLVFEGISPVEKDKLWNIQRVKYTLEIVALPKDLPKEIVVDLTLIKTTHDVLHVADIVVPKWVEILDDPKQTIATVSATSEEEIEEDEVSAVDSIEETPAAK